LNINVYNQLFNLFISILTGIIIGILFDIFRIIRKSFKTPDFITYIEDILFWILAGLILLFNLFVFNNGELRIYIFIGLIFGLFIYMLTLSKYFIKISVGILVFIKKVFYFPIHIIGSFIKKFILRPFSSIFQKVKEKTTKWIKNPIKKTANANFPNICDKIDE